MALQTENTLWFRMASALEHGLTSGVGCGGTRQKHSSFCRLTEIPFSQNLDNCRGQKCWRNLRSCRDTSSELTLSLRYMLWELSLCYHLLLFKNQNFFSSPWFLKIPLPPSSANFSFFFLPLDPPFILSFSLLFPLTKTKENSCCHWLRPRAEAGKKTMTISTMTRKCDCAESWVCVGGTRRTKGLSVWTKAYSGRKDKTPGSWGSLGIPRHMGGGDLREKTERTHRNKVLKDKLVQLDLRCPVVHKVPMNSTVSIDYYNLELCLLIQACGLAWRRGLS